jgi:hypothetical protein
MYTDRSIPPVEHVVGFGYASAPTVNKIRHYDGARRPCGYYTSGNAIPNIVAENTTRADKALKLLGIDLTIS